MFIFNLLLFGGKEEREEKAKFKKDLYIFYKKYCNKKVKHMSLIKKPTFRHTINKINLKEKEGDIYLLEVQSSNVKAIGYRNEILYVQFKSEKIYAYKKVPSQLIGDFMEAESKGKYFNLFIRKGGYNYSIVQ